MSKTIDELETEYLQLRHAREYNTNAYLYDVDYKWKAETERALVKLEEAKAAQARPVRVNQAHVELLERAHAVDGGRRYWSDQAYRDKLEAARAEVFAGRTPATLAELEIK